MTLDGRFLPEPRRMPWPGRLRPQTLLMVAGAVGVVVLGLLIWVAILMLPFLLMAGLAGWALMQFRAIRARR